MKLPPWPAMVAVGALAVMTSGGCASLANIVPQSHCDTLFLATNSATRFLKDHEDLKQALVAQALANDLPAVRAALIQAGIPQRDAAQLTLQVRDLRPDRSAPARAVWISRRCRVGTWDNPPESLVVLIVQ
jgi:hypothetical protein